MAPNKMKLSTLIENIRFLINRANVTGIVDEIKSMITHDLDGTNNDDLIGALENIENLLDDLETESNEIESAVDELEEENDLGTYDDADDADDENQL
jgi:hypothetical protein